MQEITVTLNLDILERLTDMAMNYRKGPNHIPLLIVRLAPDDEPDEDDFSLRSLFEADPDIARSRSISVQFADLDFMTSEPPLIIVESHEIDD